MTCRFNLRMIVPLVLIGLALLGEGAQAREYEGKDAGLLIYSVGNVQIPMNFVFRYRRVDPAPAPAWSDVIECRCVGFIRAQKADVDYSGRETGKVIVRRLPPGSYEVYDFGFGGSVGAVSTRYSSRKRFSIPFTVKAGEATYVGNFARAPSLGTPLERTLGAAGFFIVTDKSERDLAIARARDPRLPMVTVAVTDVSSFGHPAMRTSEP